MRPSVFSMFSITTYSCDVPHVVISISSPESNPAKLPDNANRLEALFVQFHDVIGGERMEDFSPVPFEDEHARQIVDLLARHPSAEVVCNCEAGISRSAAIAAAIASHSGDDDESYFRRYRPNTRVYRKMLEALEGRWPTRT